MDEKGLEIGQGVLSLDSAAAFQETLLDEADIKSESQDDSSASEEYPGCATGSALNGFVTREIGLSSGGVYVGLASFGLRVSIAASA